MRTDGMKDRPGPACLSTVEWGGGRGKPAFLPRPKSRLRRASVRNQKLLTFKCTDKKQKSKL